MYKNKYHWSEHTLDYFHHAMTIKTAREVYEEIQEFVENAQEFVECECDTENNKTEQDLIDDLYNTLYK